MQNENLFETTLSTERLYSGGILNLEKLSVALPNGKTAPREVVRHVGAAAVVPLDDEGYTYLVRQFRAPLGRMLLEIPAGKLDAPGEDRAQAARRELEEETGLTAEKWIHLCDIATTPGFSDEIIGLFLACGLKKGNAHPDEDEFLNVVRMPFDEAVARALRGEIEDAKTICALLLARHVIAG